MSTETATVHAETEVETNFWKQLPLLATLAGLVGCIIGYVTEGASQFAHSYLVAFMFFLSIALGGFFMVLIHHLFDAWWSVPIRRYSEHLACLLPWMALFFLPIGLLASELYPWMSLDPEKDHALHVKMVMFNPYTMEK